MITAHRGIQELDLPEDLSIEVVQVSQLFNFDKLRGDYIHSFATKDTPNNRNILNQPDRFEFRRHGAKVFDNFVVRAHGYNFINGIYELTDGFTGNVYGDVGKIASSQVDKKITDFTLKANQTFINKENYDPATDDYCAPLIQNPDFFKDIGFVGNFHVPPYNINDIDESVLQYYHRKISHAVNFRSGGEVLITTDSLNARPGDFSGGYNGNINVVTPMLYAFTTVRALLKQLHYFENENQIIDTDFIRLCIYNNLNINDISAIFKDGSTSSDSSFDNTTIYNLREIDRYTQTLRTFNYTELLPNITLKDLVLGLQNLINIAFVFDKNKYIIIDRERLFIDTAFDVDKYFTGKWYLKGKANATLKFNMQHDSNDFYFSSYYQDLSQRTSDFGIDVATHNDLLNIYNPRIGELRRVINEQRIYEYGEITTMDRNGDEHIQIGWRFVSLDFQEGKYNSEDGIASELLITTPASTVPFSGTGQVRQAGRFSMRKDTEAGFSLRLLFDEANVGKNNTSNYMLNWRYDNNLLNTRWKNTARYLANREAIEGEFLFPISVYATLNINRKWRTRHGEFFVEKMITKFTHAGIGITKIEGFKV